MNKNIHSFDDQCEQSNNNTTKKQKSNNPSQTPNNHEFSIQNRSSLTFSLLSNPDSLNIATHNIVTFKDNIKNDQILEHALINNIHILGVSETNIPFKQISLLKKNLNPLYTYFFNSHRNHSKGNRVVLIIHNSIKDHVFFSYGKDGRFIFIDLQLKNKKKLHIFQVYLHANNKDIQSRVLIQNDIISKIEDAKQKGYECIVMGDFNVDIYKDKHNNSHRKQKLNFVHKLQQLSFIDSMMITHQKDSYRQLHTWQSSNRTISSIIDYIFISSSILPTLLFSDIITPEHYRSDHNMVVAILYKKDLFNDIAMADARSSTLNKRRIFNYKKMNNEKWEAYGQAVDSLCRQNKFLNCLEETYVQSTTNLNFYWTEIRNALLNAASKNIPHHFITNNNREAIPRELTDLRSAVKKVNRILHYFNNRLIKNPLWQYQGDWIQDRELLLSILDKHKNNDLTLVSLTVNFTNVKIVKKQVHTILSFLLTEAKLEDNKYVDEQIKSFVQKRCDNLVDNPTKMIDSLLERQKRRIILDKVIVKEAESEVLITDPVKLKAAVNTHFQTIAGSKHSSKEFSEEWKHWKNVYEPLTSLDSNIYSSLMSSPFKSEWYDIINNLPKGKAVGPSQISNEMLQHVGPFTFNIIWKFICATIRLGDFPEQWKEAYVYPIPKPQEWFNRLNNTRPITLLDTVRKGVVKLLTNRLSNIFVQHRILKGYNFAALPHSSTFDAIRLMDNILQDAHDDKKEVWMLFQDMSKAYDRVNIFMLQHALKRLKLPPLFIRFITNLFLSRKNRVFTEHGLTDKYDLLVGIDQGEVICPLLWCIYYDPLLSYIQQSGLGYTQSFTWSKHITDYNVDNSISKQVTIPNAAFIDDTTWIALNKLMLETIMNIADSFY